MEGARQSETEAGRRPFMPRKALALVRAALRFAQGATDKCGRGQQADDDRLPCDEARPGSKTHQGDLHHH